MSFEFGQNREEKTDKFLDNLAWWFSERLPWPEGFFHTTGDINRNLTKLNENIEKMDKSSTKLAKALNKITLCGVIVASSGIIVALLGLGFEIYKFFYTK